jgi:hypothetical protein
MPKETLPAISTLAGELEVGTAAGDGENGEPYRCPRSGPSSGAQGDLDIEEVGVDLDGLAVARWPGCR